MSALDKQTFLPRVSVSAYPPRADIDSHLANVPTLTSELPGRQWRQPGSMPRFLNAEPASGDVRNLTSALAASASLASTIMPLENTVVCCTSAGSGPT